MLKSGLFWTAVLPTPLFLTTLFLGKLWPAAAYGMCRFQIRCTNFRLLRCQFSGHDRSYRYAELAILGITSPSS